jgi:hypothetical protein
MELHAIVAAAPSMTQAKLRWLGKASHQLNNDPNFLADVAKTILWAAVLISTLCSSINR